jgi:hypothetical protein
MSRSAEPPILRALRISLAARQYDVSVAVDGASGLAAVASQRPDVVILDLGLPDMDDTEPGKGHRFTGTGTGTGTATGPEARPPDAAARAQSLPGLDCSS